MRDDYKYSVGRIVFYRHPDPGLPYLRYGENGPERTFGTVITVVPDELDESSWIYTIRNWYNQETRQVREYDIYCGANPSNRRRKSLISFKTETDEIQEELKSDLESFVKGTISRLKVLENRLEEALSEGTELPVESGDYIRINGEFRQELQLFHGYYAKVLAVKPAEISALELNPEKWNGRRACPVKKKYTVRTEDGNQLDIYEPEIQKYYTSGGCKRILNWRAAIFLAEALGDPPPYQVDYDYLESHIFSRAELEELPHLQLAEILVNLLYVKGQLGLQDQDAHLQQFSHAPESFLIDNILFVSRFDMHRNRPMTRDEITKRVEEQNRLRKALGG